jgi:hypothetical protein
MNQLSLTEDTHLAALRAAGLSAIVRMFIENDCKYSAHIAPEFYAQLSSNLSKISNDVIDQLTLPLVRSALSLADAHSVLSFFSTPVGQSITKKSSRNDVNDLMEIELAALSDFNCSPAGTALQQFLSDPNLLPTLVEVISRYVP